MKAVIEEPFMKRIKGKDFFLPTMLQAFTGRINNLTPQSQKQWGTMTPDQMLHHLNLATESALGYFDMLMKVIYCQEPSLNG